VGLTLLAKVGMGKVSLFSLRVEITEPPLSFLHANDEWMMIVFEETRYTKEELVQLNRMHCHQQAVFYSDIFSSNGRSFNRCTGHIVLKNRNCHL
jgi:hypothetical protein